MIKKKKRWWWCSLQVYRAITGFRSMQHLSVHQTIAMRADNWKDFQVASVLWRNQNITDIHLIHCCQGKHNPIQSWFVDQIHVALDQLLLQKYQASNKERLVFQVLFQIEIPLFDGYSNDLLEHQNLLNNFRKTKP